MEIPTQKEKHSCKSSELSLKRKEGITRKTEKIKANFRGIKKVKRKEGITRKTEKIKANFRGIKKASLDNFHVDTFIYV